MKKKYTKYRASLLIGLLSLHTLSSCVNTGRALGIGGHNKSSVTYTVDSDASRGSKHNDASKGNSKRNNGWI